MLRAIVDNQLTEPSQKINGKCPLCGCKMIPKCGERNIWQWAHDKNQHCDAWYEPESEWHKRGKMTFSKENTEKVIELEGVKHIADIFTKTEVVIELQNSPISPRVIREREEFYGEKMIWVVNGIKFAKNISLNSKKGFRNMPWLNDELNSPSSKKKLQNFTWLQPHKS
jgi:competence CoiA-like predicted nuclease